MFDNKVLTNDVQRRIFTDTRVRKSNTKAPLYKPLDLPKNYLLPKRQYKKKKTSTALNLEIKSVSYRLNKTSMYYGILTVVLVETLSGRALRLRRCPLRIRRRLSREVHEVNCTTADDLCEVQHNV
jgi:hypothetical protein